MLLEISIGALGLVAIVKLVPLAERFLPARWREQLAHDRWRASCRRRGLTTKQQSEEYQFRYSVVRIQRVASPLVLADPDRVREILAKVIEAETGIVASLDKPLAARMKTTLLAADLDEVLTPEAERAALNAMWARIDKSSAQNVLTPQARADHLAALTTRK